MPVHHFIDDKILVENGLRNYWGYNTMNYFALRHGIAHPATTVDRSASSSRW